MKNFNLQGMTVLTREQQSFIMGSGTCTCGGTGTVSEQPSMDACQDFCREDRKKARELAEL